MKLSDTQRAILDAAARHPERLAYPPERLPTGARQKVAQALLRNDLVVAVHRPAYDAIAKWTVDGDEMLLKVTDDGLRAIGIDPNAGDAPEEDEQSAAAIARRNAERRATAEATATPADTAPTGGAEDAPGDASAEEVEAAHGSPWAPDEREPEEEDDRPRHERLGVDEALIYGPAEEWAPQAEDASLLDKALAERTPRGLKAAAQRVLAAWDDEANQRYDLADAIDALRAMLAGKPARAAREPGAPRTPRQGTKQEAVLAMLRRPEGATVAQIAEATGWAPHTVRGFFAGLKKRQGIEVQVLERVRQVGPNKEGARGSYTVYHIAG